MFGAVVWHSQPQDVLVSRGGALKFALFEAGVSFTNTDVLSSPYKQGGPPRRCTPLSLFSSTPDTWPDGATSRSNCDACVAVASPIDAGDLVLHHVTNGDAYGFASTTPIYLCLLTVEELERTRLAGSFGPAMCSTVVPSRLRQRSLPSPRTTRRLTSALHSCSRFYSVREWRRVNVSQPNEERKLSQWMKIRGIAIGMCGVAHCLVSQTSSFCSKNQHHGGRPVALFAAPLRHRSSPRFTQVARVAHPSRGRRSCTRSHVTKGTPRSWYGA